MSDGTLAAAVGSLAPTLASPLTYANARAARREGERNNLGGLAATVEGLRRSLHVLEAATGRIESAVGGSRERVARVEGRLGGSGSPSSGTGRLRRAGPSRPWSSTQPGMSLWTPSVPGSKAQGLEALVASQPGQQITHRFVDQASGATLEGPGLQAALSAARAGEFDVSLSTAFERRPLQQESSPHPRQRHRETDGESPRPCRALPGRQRGLGR